MTEVEFNKLVAAWIAQRNAEKGTEEYKKNSWAGEWAYDAAREAADAKANGPEDLWRFILSILHYEQSELALAVLAAGPLEDLLAKHGNTYIERVESQARQDPEFRHLLGGVWKNAMSDAIWQRVQNARLHKSW